MERAQDSPTAVTGRLGLKEGTRLKEKNRIEEDHEVEHRNMLTFYYRKVHKFEDVQPKKA